MSKKHPIKTARTAHRKELLKKLEEAAESEERELLLFNRRLTDAGVAALAQSPYMARLERLWLDHNRITDAGVTALAQSPYTASLQCLFLDHNRITDAGVTALAQSPYMALLESLGLYRNRITDAGVAALAQSPYMTGLKDLWLDHNRITDAGVAALAVSPYIAGLQYLWLDHNRITDAGATVLAQSPRLAGLQELYIDQNKSVTGESRPARAFRNRLARLSAADLRTLTPPPGFHALRVARLMALGAATDDDLFDLEPHLLPEHRAWWGGKLTLVSDANLDRALALCPHHPRLLDHKAFLLRLQKIHEDQLFS